MRPFFVTICNAVKIALNSAWVVLGTLLIWLVEFRADPVPKKIDMVVYLRENGHFFGDDFSAVYNQVDISIHILSWKNTQSSKVLVKSVKAE